MVPFLFFELKAIVSELLEIVVKSSVIKSCKNIRQLKEIDLCDESDLLPLDKMNLGFAVDQAIQKEKKSDTVNLSMIKEFKKGCQRYVTATLQKLFERSPQIFFVAQVFWIPPRRFQCPGISCMRNGRCF